MSAFVRLIFGRLTQLGDPNQDDLSAKIFQSKIGVIAELCFRVCLPYLIISIFLLTGRAGGCQLVSGRAGSENKRATLLIKSAGCESSRSGFISDDTCCHRGRLSSKQQQKAKHNNRNPLF